MAVSRLFIAVALAPALIVACQPATTNQASATPASTPKATFQVWSEDPGRRLAPADFGLPEQDVVIADPAIAHLPDGRLRMYVRAGTRGRSNLYSALSSGGLSWKVEPGIRCTQPFCVNSLPDVVALTSGGWRLFFNQHSGAGATDQTAIITSATTTDGLTFTPDPGVRVRGTDFHLNPGYDLDSPRVIALPGGGWRMYLSESSPGYSPTPLLRVFSAHSSDLIAWTPDPGVRMQGVTRPSIILRSDGTYEAFAGSFGQQGAALQCVCIGLLTSTDGLVWSTPRMVGIDGGDLVAYTAADGQVHLLYDDGDIYPPATTGLFSARPAMSTWRVEIQTMLAVPGQFNGPTHVRVKLSGAGRGITVRVVDRSHQLLRTVTGLPATVTAPTEVAFDLQQDAQVKLDQIVEVSDGVVTRFFEAHGPPVVDCETGMLCAVQKPQDNCGPGTGTPCPPTNCGPGTGTPCAPNPTGCAPNAPCLPTNCGPGMPHQCPTPLVPCQKGQPIPAQGCVTTGYDGLPKLCLPKGQDPIAPPVCQQFY